MEKKKKKTKRGGKPRKEWKERVKHRLRRKLARVVHQWPLPDDMGNYVRRRRALLKAFSPRVPDVLLLYDLHVRRLRHGWRTRGNRLRHMRRFWHRQMAYPHAGELTEEERFRWAERRLYLANDAYSEAGEDLEGVPRGTYNKRGAAKVDPDASTVSIQRPKVDPDAPTKIKRRPKRTAPTVTTTTLRRPRQGSGDRKPPELPKEAKEVLSLSNAIFRPDPSEAPTAEVKRPSSRKQSLLGRLRATMKRIFGSAAPDREAFAERLREAGMEEVQVERCLRAYDAALDQS